MSRNRYRDIAMEYAPDPVYVLGTDGTFLYANRAASALLGREPTELEGTSYLDVIHPDDRDEAAERLAALGDGRRTSVRTHLRVRAAGGIWLHVAVSGQRASLDGDVCVIGTASNVTPAVEPDPKTQGVDPFLERLVELSPMVAFRRQGPDLELTYLSPNALEILGIDPDEVLGSPIARAFESAHPEDRDKIRDQVARALDGESVEVTYRLLSPGKPTRWVVSTLQRNPTADGGMDLLGYMFDVTSRRQVEAELEWLALHDPLTGLANRAKFDSDAAIHLALSARKGWITALFYIDLDRFKGVNDTLGHDAGDEVLEVLAARIGDAVRDGDLTARLGGDEFVVMLPDVGGDAATIARRLHDALTAPVDLGRRETAVGASIGVAFFPRDAQSLDDLRRRADEAMYAAKDAGEDFRFWSDSATTPHGDAP